MSAGQPVESNRAAAAPLQVNARLCTVEEISAALDAGRILWLAGDEQALRRLPKGRWIGGSIPYFMSEDGGQTNRELIYAAEMPPDIASKLQVKFYDVDSISNVAKEAPENGFTIILIPATSEVHFSYAQNAPGYEDMFIKPVAGWVTGVDLNDLGTVKPIVLNGVTGESSHDKALVMHVTLKPNKVAVIGIVNTFSQGEGDTIEFQEAGFTVTNCLVNGLERNFAEYLREQQIDTHLPLVASYSGTMINASLQTIDDEAGTVTLYAPVFNGIKYKMAAPVGNYIDAFQAAIPKLDHDVAFSCNCVLNYMYSELEGKKTAHITGPMSFGEIAYQLLNQTMVYLTVEDM